MPDTEDQKREISSNPPLTLAMTAVWWGVIVGLLEVVLIGVKKLLLGHYVHLSIHAIWMVPVGATILISFVALGIFLVGLCCPRLNRLHFGMPLLLFVGYCNLLWLYSPLHSYSRLILAAGLAIQTGRLISHRLDGLFLVVRRTLWWMLALVAAVGIGLPQWLAHTERLQLEKLPPASSAAAPPNVLLVVLDTVRAESLSLHGYARSTSPNLSRLAGESVVFESAFSTSPWTLPSHGSMFTGHFPQVLSTGWMSPLDGTHVTLAEILSRHGYETAGFVANTHYCSRESGLNRGFIHYEDFPLSVQEIIRSSTMLRTIADLRWLRSMIAFHDDLSRISAENINGRFEKWLSTRQRRPFFAFINYFDAHQPYLPQPPFDQLFGKTDRDNPWALVDWDWTAEQMDTEQRAYDSCVAYLDHQVGELLQKLKQAEVLEDTIVIITADHGELFGEHNLMGHGNSLYVPLLHVPLILLGPNHLPAGRKVSQEVSLVDLPATVLDLLNLPEASTMPGNSLRRFWTDGPDTNTDDMSHSSDVLAEVGMGINLPPWLPIMRGDMTSVISEGLHYIRNGDGREELYDLSNDPAELRNLLPSTEADILEQIEQFRKKTNPR